MRSRVHNITTLRHLLSISNTLETIRDQRLWGKTDLTFRYFRRLFVNKSIINCIWILCYFTWERLTFQLWFSETANTFVFALKRITGNSLKVLLDFKTPKICVLCMKSYTWLWNRLFFAIHSITVSLGVFGQTQRQSWTNFEWLHKRSIDFQLMDPLVNNGNYSSATDITGRMPGLLMNGINQ